MRSKAIFIGGTSHTGKSTLGKYLAEVLNRHYRSTDSGFARHPGRPWRDPPDTVPSHVQEHYRNLNVEDLICDVLRHYRDVIWPMVVPFITPFAVEPDSEGLVLEGSALLPDLVTTLEPEDVAAVCLTASSDLLRRRIYETSLYDSRNPDEKYLIDKFLERTLSFNEIMSESAGSRGIPCIDVSGYQRVDLLADGCIAALAGN